MLISYCFSFELVERFAAKKNKNNLKGLKIA